MRKKLREDIALPSIMSERKAINKYYPPDYDPSKVVKKKKNNSSSNQTIKIRMMAPYSMRCLRCNEYIAERRSFNARKEVTNERYLNIKIVRFYITCPGCNNTITFKTNPAEAGYTPEDGAVRNFEPSKKKRKQESEDDLLKRLETEEEEDKKYQLLMKKRKNNPFWKEQDATGGDVMEKFEKRLIEQQRQQELNAELEAIQQQVESSKSKGGDEVLSKLLEKGEEENKEEIEIETEQKAEAKTEAKEKPTRNTTIASLKIPSKITIRKKTNGLPSLDYSSDSD
ncbi:Yju2 protein [Candida orthopsilosis Co 90-125]|uniref:Splicing factor YJU2 n=1 Tax=Candida orthopsilosis (strain 90-125) TaxID=1136231 RepID=H8X6I4_CANO9|nr:Yju2 protein [Candida orthopsilosis Co 90-125]CCG23595.1 Yju2 protein [Candida orthopsilosis Co 90-125]